MSEKTWEQLYEQGKLVGQLSDPDEPINPQMQEAFERANEREKRRTVEEES